MAHQRLQRREPALRQIANRRLASAAPAPTTRWRVSVGAVGAIERQRIDLERMRQRHRRIAAAAQRTASAAAPQSAAAARREAPQIVEADLRRAQARQAARAVCGLR